MKQTLLIILLIFLISQVSFAQVYKWVDEKGVTHLTDDMTQVPEKYRPRTESIETPQEREDAKVEGEIPPAKKEDSFKDRLGRGEDYWKGRVEEWRKKLRELEDKFEALRTKYNGLTDRHNDSRSMAVRTELRKERDKVKSEIEQCKTQIEEARDMLEKKIPEEAELYKAKPEWVKR
jgi:predicted  nucleic acid-binding Zn-ribbon protein